MILILNGCTDNSLKECEKAAEHFNHITIHTNEITGWGAAVIKGIEIAKHANICYTNSAKTTRENLIMVIKKYFENPDSLVKVNRSKRKLIRKCGSFLFNLEAKILFGIKTNDINGTPKIFNKNLLQDIQLKSTGDLLDLELMAIMTGKNINLIELPVYKWQRHSGKSTTKMKSAFKIYLGALKLWKSINKI
jgi:hypothetical protein